MSVSLVRRLVRPRFESGPGWVETFGPEVADLCAAAGLEPDGEQRLILDAIFGVDERGRSTAFEVAVICPRQNLKTTVFEMAVLGWLVLGPPGQLVIWSAHAFRTAQEAFRDFDQLLGGSDVLRRRVARVSRANGEEAFEMAGGSRLVFKARTKGGGRGLSGDKVILDEAFALQPEHMGALLPTLSARPDPQVCYGSSAGMADSAVLREIRDRGRKGDPRLAYFEWAAPEVCSPGCAHKPGTPGCGCDREDLWLEANPALGRRISIDYLRAERRAMPPAEFARERMGWWDEPIEISADPAIPADAWQTCLNPAVSASDLTVCAIAIDAPPSRSRGWLAVAAILPDGRVHVDLQPSQEGILWLVQAARAWQERTGATVVMDRTGPVSAILADLTRAGLQLEALSRDDVAQACGWFVAAVSDGMVSHVGDPTLTDAVTGAVWKGEAARLFSRGTATDVSPLYAAAIAAWAAQKFDIAMQVF